MVTMFSALSSSSDARMRFSSSLCGAALRGAVAVFFAGFLAAGLAEAFLLTVLAAFRGLAAFLAAFFAAGFAAVFLAAFRARILCSIGKV
jgi:hypothetical protein